MKKEKKMGKLLSLCQRLDNIISSKKMQHIFSIILLLVGILLFYIAFYNWKIQQEFLHSHKIKTQAVVKVDKNQVKTLNFTGNYYGVATDNQNLADGEQVTIYYQQDKPYRVSTSANQYGNGVKDVTVPIISGIFFIAFVGGNKILLPAVVKRYVNS